MKKQPLRKCVGCNEQKEKKDLLRVVKNKDCEVFLDKNGKANGRGAYICNDKTCFETARKRRAFERALGTSISDDIFNHIIEALDDE